MKKRIVVCMDGTWQQLNQPKITNIGIIARSIAHKTAEGAPQIVIYTYGVGSTIKAISKGGSRLSALAGALGSIAGGMFGDGLEDSILDTYLRIAFNYEAGDEIYIFGFSRGAFSARSLAALIGKCGIVSRRFAEKAQEAFDLYRDPSVTPLGETAKQFRLRYGKRVYDAQGMRHQADYRPAINYLGIFDTVGQRGLPSALGAFSSWANRRYSFHDLAIGDHVRAARHALAIDERRLAFPPTRWSNLRERNEEARKLFNAAEPPFMERWFPGTHGDVGGGNPSTLHCFPLQWIVEGAEKAGLVFDRTDNSPLTHTLAAENLNPAAAISDIGWIESLAPINWAASWRVIDDVADHKKPATPEEARALIDVSAALRAASPLLKKPYAPPPLRRYRHALLEIAAPFIETRKRIRRGLLEWLAGLFGAR